MSRGDHIEMDGTVVDALGGGQYSVTLKEGGASVRGRLSGKMKSNHIRVIPGDKVKVAVSPYDLTHGLITQRNRV